MQRPSGMDNSGRKFEGWRIAEAMRRCADPDLLSTWFAARRAWHAAGRPAGSFYRMNGYSSRYDEFATKIVDRRDQSYAHLLKSLAKHLFAGRVVARGRKQSASALAEALPASAWQHMQILDVKKSVVKELTQAKTKIYDVRIFPIVESPDVIDHLEDRTFVQAFQMSLIDDPQLNVLRKRAIAGGGSPASFGKEWHPYRAVWPVVQGQSPDIEFAIKSVKKSDEPPSDNLVKEANRIQRQRFSRLIGCFSTGRLVVEGVPAAGGASVAIPRSIWQQEGIYIDLENGGLLEVDVGRKVRVDRPLKVLFKELILRRGVSVYRIPEIPLVEPRPLTKRRVGKGRRKIVTKMTSERECFDWLIGLMRANPDDGPEAKDVYWHEAQLKWPKSLARRGFDRAWAKSVAEAPAPGWSAGGAPNKSLRAESAHQ
jgi:hypothetical protein